MAVSPRPRPTHRNGHQWTALLAYAPVAFLTLALGRPVLCPLGGVVVVGGAMVPDLDMKVPFVEHRGITHTLPFALAAGAAVGLAGGAVGSAAGPVVALEATAFGFLAGTLAVLAHLLGDVVTPAGIRPFAPLSDRRYTLDLVKAANPVANYLLLCLCAVAAAVAVGAGLTVAG